MCIENTQQNDDVVKATPWSKVLLRTLLAFPFPSEKSQTEGAGLTSLDKSCTRPPQSEGGGRDGVEGAVQAVARSAPPPGLGKQAVRWSLLFMCGRAGR